MRISSILFSALLVLSELDGISAKAFIHLHGRVKRRDYEEEMRRTAMEAVEAQISRREPQSVTSSTSSTTNSTIFDACTGALAQLSSVSNEAGFMACYNVLQFDQQQLTFQADLRLYQVSAPTGDFTGVANTDMMTALVYPPNVVFQSLTKRSLTERQSSLSELQQYTLLGTFSQTTDLAKLNQTEIMSLMIPTITIHAVKPSDQQPLSTNLTTSDAVYFVEGEFQGLSSSTALSPVTQAKALADSSIFVLPGTTLGIFPTGLIVTFTWMVLFLCAYGVGTFARFKHRTFYRKRLAASTGGRPGKK